jgi:nucleoside-diphosphate-sugar epimerase
LELPLIPARFDHIYIYAGNPNVGQSLIHKDDLIDAFVRTVNRWDGLPPKTMILIGEPDAMGYGALQNEVARLVHGAESWSTVIVPKTLARIGRGFRNGPSRWYPTSSIRAKSLSFAPSWSTSGSA